MVRNDHSPICRLRRHLIADRLAAPGHLAASAQRASGAGMYPTTYHDEYTSLDPPGELRLVALCRYIFDIMIYISRLRLPSLDTVAQLKRR